MNRLLMLLVVAAIAVPAGSAVLDYFPVTADGSFDLYRSTEGYGNGGGTGTPRFFKSNQQMGWMSFSGSTGANTGKTLAEVLLANPGARAILHFTTDARLPAPGTGSKPVGAYIVTIRCGNTGSLVEDSGSTGYGWGSPAPGFKGASEPVAFRGCTVRTGGFLAKGDGIYPGNDPANDDGVPWITPAGRKPNSGGSPFLFGPGMPIRYDIGGAGPSTGLYRGYFPDGSYGGRNYWAVEDLLGIRWNNGDAVGGSQQILDAGQLIAKVPGTDNRIVVNDTYYAGLDPWHGNNTFGNWYAIPIDAAFLADMAGNSQNKGLAFVNTVSPELSPNSGNQAFYSKQQSGGLYRPYLELLPPANVLSLDATSASLFVQPGESVVINMDVANLAQMVNGCQALLGYSSAYFTAPYTVAPGGGPWTELIYESWAVPGELDTAIGVTLEGGPAGTTADGTVAIIALTAGTTEGTTQVVFRPDGESGYATMLSDLNAQPVWPNKVNSANIVIDGTPPVLATVPADATTNAVTVAQQTITGTVSDALAGLETLTCTFNGGPAAVVPVTTGAFSQSFTLVPGANAVIFTATDKAGNVATSTVNYTYTQPAPTVEVFRSLAPNKYGSPSWGAWLANAVEGAKSRSAQGSGYARFEDFGNALQDYSSVTVSAFHSWKGLLSADPEPGTAIHFVWRLDNGVQANAGAAKLDVTRINITLNDIWLGADGAVGNLTTDYSSWWNGIAAGASFGGTSGFGSGLKGFDWDGSQWVPVTSGTQADLIVYAWFRYAQAPEGNPPTPDQAVLNTLYKQMSGAAAFSGDPRRTLDRQELEVRYSGHAGVGDGTSGSLTTAYTSADTTAPVVAITAPADGAEVKVAGQTITGSVTDAEVLASGVREVTITLNGGIVYTSTVADPVSFSQAVTLIEGDNIITVAAEDFAGNTASRTIHVYLDTVAPALTIDSAVQGGNELLISLGSTTNAVQGTVTITVSSSDASPSTGLVVPPAVKVTDATAVETVLTAAGSGPWTYTYTVTPATANGIAAISATISDEVGNSSSASDTFRVNKNQVTGQVQLQAFTGMGTSPLHARVVKFVATGGVARKEWTLALTNVSGAVFDYTLTDVPAGTTGLSADTAWSLRSKLAVALNLDGQATAAFTGADILLGGDLNDDNIVNILDYSVLKARWFTTAPEADVNGDGLVNTLDYSIQKANWFIRGDAE